MQCPMTKENVDDSWRKAAKLLKKYIKSRLFFTYFKYLNKY